MGGGRLRLYCRLSETVRRPRPLKSVREEREKKLESKTSREIRERENSREAAKRLKLGDKNVKMKSATLPILSRGLREFAAGPFPSFFFFLSSPPRGKSGTVCVAAVDVLLNKKKLPRSFY